MTDKIKIHGKASRQGADKFVLIWHHGGYISGDDWVVSSHYCRAKNLILGLVKIAGRNKLLYSFKIDGIWEPQGIIDDTGDYEKSRKAAFKHFFKNKLLKLQDDFNIFPVLDE
ncbi:MAG: hypothetical protein IJP88_09990 [Synergistaceae bacterium]|nr:hypothetical protein [Synergistaceae bacterium]